jgi:hypothetical protein
MLALTRLPADLPEEPIPSYGRRRRGSSPDYEITAFVL